jgi:hypothetical protein
MEVLRNVAYRVRYASDFKRWIFFHNGDQRWRERQIKVAHLVPPRSGLVELCVAGGQLTPFLDPSVVHAAANPLRCTRRECVWTLDGWPMILAGREIDVAAICGMLEYVPQIEGAAAWLALHVSLCVVSYPCVAAKNVVTRCIAAVVRRVYHGYRSALAEPEVVAIFERCGFRCIARDPWQDERIFLFCAERAKDRGSVS